MSADLLMVRKYLISTNQARRMHAEIKTRARELTMNCDLSRAQPTLTCHTHHLVALANSHDRARELIWRLYQAYFYEGLLLSGNVVFESQASDVGVD